MTVADAITATLVSCTEHVRANIPGAKRDEDPEALHQLRVGVRRLRAALSAYREAMPPGERRAVSRAFRRFERNLSPARDWDVLIEKYGKAGRGDRDKRDLIERAEAQRAEAHRRLANMISQTPISRLLKRAQQLVHGKRSTSALRTPIRDFAGKVLDRRDRRARKLGRGMRSLGAKDLHRLRICVKKLRYAGEFFMGLWPTAATKAYVQALKRLQDELGEMEDATSAARLIADIDPEHGEGGRRAREWAKASREHASCRIFRYWRDFKDAPRFWKLS